ncbi:hypothetical protein WMY93_032459 [Mugilogobius chulae]|uniref:Cytochrome c oxidase subunit 7A2 n=1 Tax=Mugilogobius chulae TaxID=88201 RepID=A0AAW0MKQ4_9GOBI
MFRQIQALQVLARRSIGSSAMRQSNKVPNKQKMFQEDNGMPIHLKGGSSDALLYRGTMVLTVLETFCVEFACSPRVCEQQRRANRRDIFSFRVKKELVTSSTSW